MKRTSSVMLLALTLVVLLSAPVVAEPPHEGPPRGGPPDVMMPPGMMGTHTRPQTWEAPAGPPGMMGPPVFLAHVFPPELVMRYQSELGLTPAQQEAMTRIMAEAQAKLVELQWKFEAAGQALTKMMEKDAVDEEAALAQWDQLSGVEQQIKKTHLGLLLRIKNQLTPAQQEQLRALRPHRLGLLFHRGPEAHSGPPFSQGPDD